MTNQEIQAIRGHLEGVEKGFYKNMNILSEVYLKDVPKLLDEIDWQKNNVEGYRSNWHKAVHEIQQLRQELDELRKEYERLRKYATEIAAEGSAESERLHKKIKWLEANNKLLAEELE